MPRLGSAPGRNSTRRHHDGHLACSSADAISGWNELLQYERLLTSGYKPPRNTSQVCSYVVGEPHAEGASGCVAFRITQTCPNTGAPLGGTTFRVEARGASLVLCAVTDLFNGRYRVGCPRPAAGCMQVRVNLGYERYQAFENSEAGGSEVGWWFGKTINGVRSPPMTVLAERKWCADLPATGEATVPPPCTPSVQWHRRVDEHDLRALR